MKNKLTSREPTWEMIEAGIKSHRKYNSLAAAWRAMHDESPEERRVLPMAWMKVDKDTGEYALIKDEEMPDEWDEDRWRFEPLHLHPGPRQAEVLEVLEKLSSVLHDSDGNISQVLLLNATNNLVIQAALDKLRDIGNNWR
jgi:hypothetical protein